ncbi:response regulator [Roseateles oligotrophus]|uniref:Response regulator transcription factor n=1 Tax=Roseateles oligotrophus TaxID=1769250 RepID=A0ABT2YGP1_9BURK|nr:response regulator transcription factor [Roseateles oligotrophus]MCV2369212.1 response regulator transcription factor [Roseateles oligotrophus]
MNIRVMVVDDHSLFRRGLTALLAHEPGLEVVGEAADGSEALRRVKDLQPAVVLLDNHMPGVRGVDLLPGLLEIAPDTQFIMLTVSEDEEDLAAALRAGAAGYLLKTIDGQDLAAAIRRAVGGESVVSAEMTHKLVRVFKASSAAAPPAAPVSALVEESLLSPREQELLREIVRGASNKEIARTLGIAETTVKIHVQHILRKLNLSSRVQVAVWASERGLG